MERNSNRTSSVPVLDKFDLVLVLGLFYPPRVMFNQFEKENGITLQWCHSPCSAALCFLAKHKRWESKKTNRGRKVQFFCPQNLFAFLFNIWTGMKGSKYTAIGPILARLGPARHEMVPNGRGFFYFFIFYFCFLQKIYFRFGNLQKYTPAALYKVFAPSPDRKSVV